MDDRDAAANADMKRLQSKLLPDLQGIIRRVADLVLGRGDENLTPRGVAAEYRLWEKSSVQELTTHYNKFEASLSVAGRKAEGADSAEEFARDITRLNVKETFDTFMSEHQPQLNEEQAGSINQTFGKVQNLAETLDIQNVSAMDAARRKDGWRKGG